MPDGGALLIPDACALLDVLRGATGMRPQAPVLEPFKQLARSGAAGDLRIVVPGLALSGFDRNLDTVTSEAVAHGRRVLEGMTMLVAGHAALPDSEGLVLSGPTPPSVEGNWARELAEAWGRSIRAEIDSWDVEEHTAGDTDYARNRMTAGLAPCKQGGDGFEDAEIISCALRLAGAHIGPVLFVSSNTSDFCESGSSALHPDLEADFGGVGLELVTTWGAALGNLRSREETSEASS